MKVIKNGMDAKRSPPKRYTCVRCDSILEVSREEMSARKSDRDGDYYTFVCPVCRNETFVAAPVVEAL